MQQTHLYHPILHASQLWQAVETDMIDTAIRSPEYRAAKEAQRKRHSAAADSAWKPEQEVSK